MDLNKLISKLHPLERRVLPFLERSVSFDDIVKESGLKDVEVMRALQDKSTAWAASACYYSMYYSLYAVLMRMGIKSEIHSCSMLAMNYLLGEHYSKEDGILLERAFEARIENQYYVIDIPQAQKLDALFDGAVVFYEKSQGVLMKINEQDIETVRDIVRRLGVN